jgi:hypothetical protein
VLDPALQAQRRVERHGLLAALAAAEPPAHELHLARERDEPTGRPAVRRQVAAAAGAADRLGHGRLEPLQQRGPQPARRVREARAHRPLERADVRTLGAELQVERDRDGDRLHGEPLRLLVI